jgi:putative nucleotidyltransferase with HDIG domain
VYETWLEAWKMSNADRLEDISFLPGVLPDINNVAHTRAVTALSIQTARLMTEFFDIHLNMDYLIAGAILHDIGKCFRPSPGSMGMARLFTHPISGGYVAAKVDLPLEVIHIIAAHSLEGDLIKRTPEAAIVHYMDFACAEVTLRAKTESNLDGFMKWMGSKDLNKTFAAQ